MHDEPPMAKIGALIGSPVRARMLTILFDGRALTATELSNEVGVAPATASEHLGLLLEGGLVSMEKSGRHRYYSLTSPEVAQALENLVVELSPVKDRRLIAPKLLKPIQKARFYYDHIAGRLGVKIADALLDKGALFVSGGHYQVTESGLQLFANMSVSLDEAKAKKRIFAKQCLDWSERRHHISGSLGAALADTALKKRWVARTHERRVLYVTPEGKRAFNDLLDLKL